MNMTVIEVVWLLESKGITAVVAMLNGQGQVDVVRCFCGEEVSETGEMGRPGPPQAPQGNPATIVDPEAHV